MKVHGLETLKEADNRVMGPSGDFRLLGASRL